ncbi:Oidioi.mRNA.OKI2018_I69.XSR.g15980.t1.cds [Oikopleura dioica]|uniref:Oidioi.mRNA.OKI2018_I69.XSR.g15980.t1.cds n=1 Tax=Oikopleura dioica TaxID=34765 RepID=A0ABN7SNW8_OIKDI|nr:Oidioi.mRNA.OKI2018_I69.XSR.g15980.t1.cds [Oikopleura dioica]
MKQCEERTEYSKAFISAIVDQDLDFVREVLPYADVNFKDPLGMTAIHFVMRLYPDNKLHETIKLLRDHDARLDMADPFGNLPIHLACTRANPLLALTILKEFGAKITNTSNKNNANALHFLFCSFSECNEFEDIFGALEFLQRYGVDENQADQGGQTPKKYAFKKFGKRNEMLWKVSAALSQTDSTAELCDRARTRKLSASEISTKKFGARRRNSIADISRKTEFCLH